MYHTLATANHVGNFNIKTYLANSTQSTPLIFPTMRQSDGAPKGVSTEISFAPSKISGLFRPDPPIIPI